MTTSDMIRKLSEEFNISLAELSRHIGQSSQNFNKKLKHETEGDDEQLKVDFSKVPDAVTKIDFTITINDAESRNQNFGQVSNAYIRILDETIGEELIRYDHGEDYSVETAVYCRWTL